MKTLLTGLFLAATMLPALSQAQTVDICDRTPQVRDEILLELEASDCATVTAAQLATISKLCFTDMRSTNFDCRSTYSRNPLVSLKPSDFDGLTGLQGLILSDNQLTALPDGVFDGLTSLVELSLYDNQLTALPEGLFDGLTSLVALPL